MTWVVDFDKEIRHIGEGWRPIVRQLHEELLQIDPNLQLLQIKEKFGGLRYYYNSNHPQQETMQRLVAEAEDKCGVTCEECGAPGENKPVRGWYRTFCDACREKVTNRE